MWANEALSKLEDGVRYSRSELFSALSETKPSWNKATLNWALYNLLKKQSIFKVSHDSYAKAPCQKKPIYKPDYSDLALAVMKVLGKKYPDMDFVVFESALLNEFLNHLIAQNTVYVQVEKDLSSYIFHEFRNLFSKNVVLYKPSKDDFDVYRKKDCIVVSDLKCQSPLSKESPHEIILEKMLVDLLAEKNIAAAFSPAEMPFVFENASESYAIDMRKIRRYAKRRGKAALIGKYLGGETECYRKICTPKITSKASESGQETTPPCSKG